jgi:hypothetical protein
MTEAETKPKPKRGRPFNVFGPRRRRSRLAADLVRQIGGVDKLTPTISEAIFTAVELHFMASELRAKFTKAGADAATAEELVALVRLETSAAQAMARLDIPAKHGDAVSIDAISTVAA